jgi:hypothetical protein
MKCSGCGLQLALEDNFCRRCGASTGIIDVPAVRGEARPPNVWQDARPVVARGVVLIAAGAILRFVVARAGKALLSRATSGAGPLARFAPGGGERLTQGHVEDVEMIWYRRIRR